jgi:hypothetical protein
VLAGKQSPLAGETEGKIHLVLRRQIEKYKRDDPSTKRKIALPYSAIKHLCQTRLDHNPKQQAIHDLCTIAWFYLLRVGEYTTTATTARRRTQQFRLCDITFYEAVGEAHRILDPSLPLPVLLQRCDAASLCISNQKNGKRDAIIHHKATQDITCPVAALARRVNHIWKHTTAPNTMIGAYFTHKGASAQHFTPTNINNTLKACVVVLGLPRYNIHPADVSSHSLRAGGGGCALHQAGVDSATIKILGRWSSDTFLQYIQEQFAAFSTNLSALMSRATLSTNLCIRSRGPPN